MEAAIEESADLGLVKGQFLHLPPVVQTEVDQVFCGSCAGEQRSIRRVTFLIMSHFRMVTAG